MPNIGDKARGTDIGYKSSSFYTYFACPDCGKARWLQSSQLKKYKGMCYTCAGVRNQGKPKPTIRGAGNPAWKGGRTIMKTGYIRMPIYVDDAYFPMAMGDSKTSRPRHFWITEHRYVMAKHLGRCLESWEVVHHKNGNKTDNRIENLELLPDKIQSRQTHMAFTLLQQANEKLKQRITELESELSKLRRER